MYVDIGLPGMFEENTGELVVEMKVFL